MERKERPRHQQSLLTPSETLPDSLQARQPKLAHRHIPLFPISSSVLSLFFFAHILSPHCKFISWAVSPPANSFRCLLPVTVSRETLGLFLDGLWEQGLSPLLACVLYMPIMTISSLGMNIPGTQGSFPPSYSYSVS